MSTIITPTLVQAFVDEWSKVQWTNGGSPGQLPKIDNLVPTAEEIMDRVFPTIGIKTTFVADDDKVGPDLVGDALCNLPTPDSEDKTFSWTDESTASQAKDAAYSLLLLALGIAYNYGMITVSR